MAIITKADRDREKRINRERVFRARELIALLDECKVEIGWEGRDTTTFTPMADCPPKLIQEATILTREIRAIKEGRIKFVTIKP